MSAAEKNDAPHVVLRGSTFLCEHCGANYEMMLPVPIDVMLGAMKAFSATHKRCALTERGRACSFCFERGHDEKTCPRSEYHGSWREWLAGPDTGISSKAIQQKLSGAAYITSGRPFGNVPMDPADFGRCHRLLHAIPGWRARIGEMADEPGWAKLVEHWDALEALYLEESPSGKCPKLYALMQKCGA